MFEFQTSIYVYQFESTCLLLAVPAFARWRVFECDGVQWTEAGQGSGTGGATLRLLALPDQTVKSAEPDIHPCACGASAGFLTPLLCFLTLWLLPGAKSEARAGGSARVAPGELGIAGIVGFPASVFVDRVQSTC